MSLKTVIATFTLAGFSLFGINAAAQHSQHHAASNGCPQASGTMQPGMMGKGMMSGQMKMTRQQMMKQQQNTQKLINQMKQGFSALQSETLPPDVQAKLEEIGRASCRERV